MTTLVAQKDMVKVWPLRPGVWGLNSVGAPSLLQPGKRGWMHRENVDIAVQEGAVQRIVGERMENLRVPTMEASRVTTAAVRAEDDTEAQPPSKKRRRRGYRRRDLRAEQEPVPFIHGPPAADAG